MPEPTLAPLLPSDPPHIDAFWLDARLHASPAGVVFLAHDEQRQVRLILLSEGSAQDKAARDRFSGVVNQLHIDTVIARGGQDQDLGRLGRRFREPRDSPLPADSSPLAPWVALSWNGEESDLEQARTILNTVQLEDVQQDVRGTDFQHYWLTNTKAGRTRTFPLPWPGRPTRAGWLPILWSWLLMLLLAAVALLIAWLLFRDAAPAPEPLPVPQGQSGSASSSASSSSSAEPSSSPDAGDPTSAEPSSSATGDGSPSPPRL